jgi:hypothetical protein
MITKQKSELERFLYIFRTDIRVYEKDSKDSNHCWYRSHNFSHISIPRTNKEFF